MAAGLMVVKFRFVVDLVAMYYFMAEVLVVSFHFALGDFVMMNHFIVVAGLMVVKFRFALGDFVMMNHFIVAAGLMVVKLRFVVVQIN
jgi:hypothetical protein